MFMRQFGAAFLGLMLSGAACASETTAVTAVKKLGGTVIRDSKIAGEPAIFVDLSNTKVTDAGLKHIKELNQLIVLSLGNTQVTDAGLKELKGLKQLLLLDLEETKITDTGLKELKELKTLTWLNLHGTKVTDAGIKELQEALPTCKILP
jgi:hypothetical protein